MNKAKKSTKVAKTTGAEPFLPLGGNPEIAKADGDAPVQAYIAAIPGWKSEVGRYLDDLIVRTVPDVRKGVRWNSPFYGATFLNGASLRPLPPRSGKDPDSRWIDGHEGELDEEQMATWIRQSAALPGWRGF